MSTCRVDALLKVQAFLAGHDSDGDFQCPSDAEHTTTVAVAGFGWEVEIHTDVCSAHERVIQVAEGWKTSRKLRTPSPT